MKLVATAHFDGYTPGQEITDAAAIESILAGEKAHHVVKVASDPEPDSGAAPAAPKTAKSK